MNYATALELIGGLSEPSKMPWYGWSTPASACITGGNLRSIPESVCSKCYAWKGRYSFPHVKSCLDRRLAAVTHPDFIEAFVVVLQQKYERTKLTRRVGRKTIKENRFRWHDSGDVSSLLHLQAINQIALQTPELEHWLPTRELQFIKQMKKFSDNLVVRFSFPTIGGKAIGSKLPQATVGRPQDPIQCTAAVRGGKCGDCAICWSRSDVNYPLH